MSSIHPTNQASHVGGISSRRLVWEGLTMVVASVPFAFSSLLIGNGGSGVSFGFGVWAFGLALSGLGYFQLASSLHQSTNERDTIGVHHWLWGAAGLQWTASAAGIGAVIWNSSSGLGWNETGAVASMSGASFLAFAAYCKFHASVYPELSDDYISEQRAARMHVLPIFAVILGVAAFSSGSRMAAFFSSALTIFQPVLMLPMLLAVRQIPSHVSDPSKETLWLRVTGIVWMLIGSAMVFGCFAGCVSECSHWRTANGEVLVYSVIAATIALPGLRWMITGGFDVARKPLSLFGSLWIPGCLGVLFWGCVFAIGTINGIG